MDANLDLSRLQTKYLTEEFKKSTRKAKPIPIQEFRVPPGILGEELFQNTC